MRIDLDKILRAIGESTISASIPSPAVPLGVPVRWSSMGGIVGVDKYTCVCKKCNAVFNSESECTDKNCPVCQGKGL